MVNIELPKSEIDFKIGDQHFILSLKDTSRGKFLESYDKISAKEVESFNKRDIEVTEYNQNQANLEARFHSDEEMSELDFRKESIKLSDQFSKRMKKNNSNRSKALIKLQFDYLDVCFGKGSGQKLYELCDESSIVLNQVIIMINDEIQSRTNAGDFYSNYKKKLEEMKSNESTDTEQDKLQE
ncbi:hypothetical protein [Companilactobacillus alimentarius]|uniref:hypothetical protein n=1 Tax=Companilactobacillus alimentarius TaxID=1602 RepID=UPI0028B8FE69|nr:hypothetical protein [Companilactobacillus alimentarius]MDT6953219.1 hypothetical protein [Companilactobacillus alimentarius]